MPPVISNLVFTKTASTIVATWDTDISSDSHMTAGGKLAVDDGVAANVTTGHQCVVAGLLPSTVYSCIVTSGGVSSSPSNQTTNALDTRTPIRSASLGNSYKLLTVKGDTNFTAVSNDNKTYISEGDGQGFVVSTPNAGANVQVGVLTNESTTYAGTLVNLLTAYGGFNTFNGTDGPSSAALSSKPTGLFAMLGNLYMWVTRQGPSGSGGAWYNNVIKSTDKGATWNNYQAPSTFNAAGSPINTATFPLPSKTYGWVSPIRYGADDGTIGYNTAGNQIDGANAYVYQVFVVVPFLTGQDQNTPAYLLRQPRIKLDAQDASANQYWIGPASPTPADFVNDANWSNSDSGKVAIFTPANAATWPVVSFVAGLNRYILTTIGKDPAAGGDWTTRFYESAVPVGPWTPILSSTNSQEYYGFIPFHRDLYSNVATDNVSLRMFFAGNPTVPANYFPTIATVILSTTKTLPSFVQSAGSTTAITGSAYTKAFQSPVTKGNLLIVAWRRTTAGGTVTGVTDTVGSSWTVVYDTSDGGAASGGWAWAIAAASGANTVSVNLSASIGGGVIAVGEWTGVNTPRGSLPAAHAVLNTFTPTSNSYTATAADLLIGVDETGGNMTTVAPGTGYLMRQRAGDSGFFYVNFEDNLVAAGGATTASFTNNSNVGGTSAGIGGFFLTAFAISGSAGLPGATVSWSGPSGSGSVIADGSGNFSIPNLIAGVYTLTPSSAGRSFSPVSSSQTVTNANITGVNFTAIGLGPATQITITMRDSSTVVLSIPTNQVVSQFLQSLLRDGGTWDLPPDVNPGAKWWPYRDWKKVLTS